MIDWTSVAEGIQAFLQWQNFFFIIFGMTLGIVLGAIPGFTGSLGIAIVLPLTFNMDPMPALVFLLSIYTGGLFGGAITAVLINTPGSPAAVATTFDGYPMTKDGKSSRALGLAIMSSTIGGLIGVIVLFLIIEPLATIALKFGPLEMFMIAVFGLTIIAALKGDSFIKSIFAGLLGVLLGTIGMTSTGAIRGTFGIVELMDGIPLIPALIGLFAISELFMLVDQDYIASDNMKSNNLNSLIGGLKRAIKSPLNLLRSSAIGVGIGALPAAGSTVASLLSYNEAKRFSKEKHKFGKGHDEGIIAAESANNSSEGGALATMLVLGIPGSASTAMLLGAIIMQGWVPGPRLFIDHSEVLYGAIFSEFVQMFALLFIGVFICLVATKVVLIPTRILIPVITIFALIGAFAERHLIFDAALVFIFGLIGWYMRKNNYPTISVVLGLILGPIADEELLRSVQIHGDQTFVAFFQSPISLTIIIITIFGAVIPTIVGAIRKKPNA